LGAQHGKLDADLRTSALLGTPSVQSIHDYYPFAMEDGGRSGPMAAKLVDRLAMLVVVRRFPSMSVADSRSLRFDIYFRLPHFVRRTTFVPLRRFLGMCEVNFMQRLFVALYGAMGSYLRDAFHEGIADVVACLPVPRAWVFPSFLLFAWWPPLLFLAIIFCNFEKVMLVDSTKGTSFVIEISLSEKAMLIIFFVHLKF
jgi:hypothetical protein